MILTITLNASIDKRYVTKGAKQGEVNRVLQCEYTPGGKGLNVSKVLRISGADVLAGGFTGGYAGGYIEDKLKEKGINCDFYHVPGESRSCINIWDLETKQQTEYLEPGFEVSPADVNGFLDKYKKQAEEVSLISISGSVPRGVKNDIYKELVDIAISSGKKVILDTSGELLEQGIKAKPTLIKPNTDEIKMLTGKDCLDTDTLIEAAIRIHEDGVAYVVISMGGDGSLLVSKDGVFQAIIPKIQAENTVGCGDAMIAGFALGLSQELREEELLKKASAISAASAMSIKTGFYEPEIMKDIYKDIIIKKINR